jgi:hypothetical protein
MDNTEIRQLGHHDVLLGRGTGPNEAIGNMRLRQSIRVILDEVSTGRSMSDRRTKAEFANIIIAEIKENGGKFLKKVSFGSASETTRDPSLDSVYEEVSDSVAFSKVKQCIRHQLVHALSARATRKSKKISTIQSFKNFKASRRFLSEPNSPSSRPRNDCSFDQIKQSPVAISVVMVHPDENPHQSDDQCRAFRGDMLLPPMQSAPANAAANSEKQACVLDKPLGEIRFRNSRHRDRAPSNTPKSTFARPPLHLVANNDSNIILQLVELQEKALLQNALVARRNNGCLFKADVFSPATQPKVLASPLVMFQALRAQELGSRCLQWSSGSGTFLYRSSPVSSPFL